MKTSNQISRLITHIAALMFFVAVIGCGGNDPSVSETDKVTNLLKANTWKIQDVTVDGVSQISSYQNFTIAFAKGGFTTTHGGVAWPTTGTWTLNQTAKSFTRNDGVTVNIDNISDSSLSLSFTWSKTTLGGGRVASTSGKHVFILLK